MSSVYGLCRLRIFTFLISFRFKSKQLSSFLGPVSSVQLLSAAYYGCVILAKKSICGRNFWDELSTIGKYFCGFFYYNYFPNLKLLTNWQPELARNSSMLT